MIYFVSDLHGEWSAGLSQYLENYREGDLLLILGDVGLSFEDTPENRRFTERFLSLCRPIAFLDGNHENHPYLNAFPLEPWCGGTVNRLSRYIVRLRRGEIYEIGGRTFFTLGGCKSSAFWRDRGLLYDGEEPSREEISYGLENLCRLGDRIDYILTHKYDPDAQAADPLTLEGICSYIDRGVRFRHWYSGHWHEQIAFDDRHTAVYDTLLPLE